jgi:hypothetical protein
MLSGFSDAALSGVEHAMAQEDDSYLYMQGGGVVVPAAGPVRYTNKCAAIYQRSPKYDDVVELARGVCYVMCCCALWGLCCKSTESIYIV